LENSRATPEDPLMRAAGTYCGLDRGQSRAWGPETVHSPSLRPGQPAGEP
jgi:hypothetical protein